MANKYCDHGLYAAPITGGTVPTASEDGNGKGTGAAAMATLVLALTGQPTAGQAITVAGVTFTAVASGATGNQFNIGAAASNTAANLAAAINASTTNAVKPTGVIHATAPLRNVVNACVSGSTVTVYTRCSGSDWNSVTETSTLSNCTVTQWSGGTDGAWGYLFNEVSIFPTAKAMGAYGVWASQAPYLGVFDAGDVVNCRSNKTLAVIAAAGVTVTLSAMGTATSPVIFLFDDSTIWSDGANPVFRITHKNTTNSALNFTYSIGTFAVIRCSVYSDSARGLDIYTTTDTVGSSLIQLLAGVGGLGSVKWDGAALRTTSSAGFLRIAIQPSFGMSGNAPFICYNVLFDNYTNKSAVPIVNLSSSVAGLIRLLNCLFNVVAPTDVFNPIIAITPTATTMVDLIGCRFTGFVAGSRLIGATALSNSALVTAFDCDFGNVTVLGPNFIATNPSASAFCKVDRAPIGFVAASKYGTRDYISDTVQGMVQWVGSLGFPTLNARLLDNTPWSIQVIPTTYSGGISVMSPLVLPGISKVNSLATAQRTVSLPFGLEKSLSWTKNDVWFDIEYVDENGIRRYESTLDYAAGALDAATDAWSSNTDDGGTTRFTWASPTLLYFNRYRLQLTTAHQIATNTEFTVFINIGNTVADTTKMAFFDPEVLVS